VSRIELQRLSADQATADLDRLFGVWCAAFGLTADDGAARGWRDHGWPSQSTFPGLRFFAVYRDGGPIGFAYGYRGARGQWWTDRFAEALGPDIAEDWIGDHFELSEIAVQPASAGRGLGGLLHDAVLAGADGRRALLCTALGDTPARRLFDHRGWTPLDVLGEGFAVLGRAVSTGQRKRANE
jgi:GNAT superfamily N-acetyltransferase